MERLHLRGRRAPMASADGVTLPEHRSISISWTEQPSTALLEPDRTAWSATTVERPVPPAPTDVGCSFPATGRAVPDQPVEGEAADVRTVHRPSPPCRRPGPGRGPDAQPQLHRHRAHPPGPDPRG